MITIERTVPAPEELINPMIGVPEGSDLSLDLMAESVIEGVLLSGTVDMDLQGSCSRCLEPMTAELQVDVQELFRHEDLDRQAHDEELPTFDHNLIDLEPTLRDAIVLALPLAPICSEDCLGLCPECGIRLADQVEHEHDQTDPRWAALAGFAEQDRGESHGTKEED